LLFGRSIPAIRTISLALPLLVSWIPLADDPNDTAPPNQLAVLADPLNARSYLHLPALFQLFWVSLLRYPADPEYQWRVPIAAASRIARP
jgi:hypothetical protein